MLPARTSPREGAFTIIELIVVMVIVAILCSIAIPTFLGQKQSARRAKVLLDLQTFDAAVKSCAAENADHSYYGCLGQDELAKNIDPSLRKIPWVEGPNPDEPEGSVDVDAITSSGTVVKAPNVMYGSVKDEVHYRAYIATSWLKEGDRRIWLSIIRNDTGTAVERSCGLLPATGHASSYAAPATLAPLPGSRVPGSKICPNGSWN